MNIVNKLTLRHLKDNKKRTVITVIGIIISVAMITATCVSVTSLFSFLAKQNLVLHGNWHYATENVTEEQIDALADNGGLEYVSVYSDCSEKGSAVNIHNAQRESLGIAGIGVGNRDFFDAFITAPYTGSFPVNETEIMVSRDFLNKNALNWRIGDRVTVDVGHRLFAEDGGEASILVGNYVVGEQFQSLGNSTFTVVGILEETNSPTKNVKLLRGLAEGEADGAEVYLTANVLDKTTESVINDAVTISGASKDGGRFNKDLFRYRFIIREADSAMVTIVGFSSIILAVIIVASVMLIYNAFGISISERARYLGMLASVGATRAQKRRSVYYEGAILGMIGIPLGFGAGILGMAVTFRLLEPVIAESGLNVAGGLKLSLDFPWWILPVIALLSAVTIAVSAFIPARKASRTTPIDALRQRTDVKVKSKKLRSPKTVRKIFGYEGELAYKNMKRNGKKSRVITSSLVLSIVLFLSVNTFCSMFQEANRMSTDIPYQISVNVLAEDAARFRTEAAKLDGVDALYGVQMITLRDMKTDSKNYKSAYKNKLSEKGFTLFVTIVDDVDFNALCTENGIDYKQFYNSDAALPLLMLNGMDRTETAVKVFEDSIVNTNLQYEDEAALPLCVKGLVKYRESDNYCYGLLPANILGAYTPKSAAADRMSFPIDMVGFETEVHEQLTEEIRQLLETGGYEQSFVSDYEETAKMMNSTIMIMQVFIYGFIALMTLISAANIFNTVSTSIDLRRKEFAMLKSVGVTPKGFRRMLRFESLFYGLKALVYGLPLSVAISLLMWWALTTGDIDIPYHPDWRIYLGVILAVFLIVGLSMVYSTHKVKKDSIIETLKSEIT